MRVRKHGMTGVGSPMCVRIMPTVVSVRDLCRGQHEADDGGDREEGGDQPSGVP
jgi:hypothetical protein